MPEPITLAVVGTIALTEGIKFLYNQAGEVLKRRRERRDVAAKAKAEAEAKEAAQPPSEPVNVKLPEAAFEGQLVSPKINFDAAEKLAEPIAELRKELSGYADGTEEVNTSDEKLLQNIDALRQALEAVYQQRLTFKGEQREASGPTVEGRIDVETVKGYVAAVRAKNVYAGDIRADIKSKLVESGGSVVGVEIENLGKPPDGK